MSEALLEEGYQVGTAQNGRQALDYLAPGVLPHLIILDLTMPVMDGHEFLENRARQPALACIPVTIVSATAYPNVRWPGVEVLRKPVDLEILLENISRRVG